MRPAVCAAMFAIVAGCGRLRFEDRPTSDAGDSDGAPSTGPSLFGQTIAAMSGLVGYWAFDGDLDDSGPNLQHGIARSLVAGGVSTCTDLEGRGGVLITNTGGEQSFVEVPTPIGSVFDSPTISLVVWARADVFPDPGAAEAWSSLVDRNSLWYMTLFSTQGSLPTYGEYAVRLYGDSTPATGGGNRVGLEPRPVPPVLVDVGDWHMYTLTYDGSTVVAYYDGGLLAQEAYAGPLGPTGATPTMPPFGNYNLTWGAWQQRGDWFTGCFDDTAYFNRALTAQEVAMLFATK